MLEHFLRIYLFYWYNLLEAIAIEVVRTIHVQIVYRNQSSGFRCRKQLNAQFPDYQRYQSQILVAQIEDLYEDRVKISRPYLIYRVLFNITILNFELLWL